LREHFRRKAILNNHARRAGHNRKGEKKRMEAAEFLKLSPAQQLAEARKNTPPPATPTTHLLPHMADEHFDRIIGLKTSDPAQYQVMVGRMSAHQLMTFSRYAENKAAHEQREGEQREKAAGTEAAEKERASLNKLRREMGLPLE
jgi:hypothetical protein